MQKADIFRQLGLSEENSGAFAGEWLETTGDVIDVENPSNRETVATVRQAAPDDYETVARRAVETFEEWRMLPAPKRGDYVRRIGDALRDLKEPLGALIALENGKIVAEGEGEVQEAIDMADFAVGLSRQLYGPVMASERPRHRMYEQWHPLGPVGIITAFNFPIAPWSWNAMVAAVCGDPLIWKPSSMAPLTAIATIRICQQVMEGSGFEAVFGLVVGRGSDVGDLLVRDRRVPLISATGSCEMGRKVAPVVAERMGRTVLELGGNNGIIVMDDADLELAVRAVLFAAVGTAGQRCTTTRRLIVQRGVAEQMTERLIEAYRQVRIGDPLDPDTLMGPLISEQAVKEMMEALEAAKSQGGEVLYGGSRVEDLPGHFVEPTIVRIGKDAPIVKEETFAPILYVIEVEDLDEAIGVHNAVDQGLSSAIFTESLKASETFLSAAGSDCGIANVNIGTSGAEIGGAFGGEKETGGGREAGSDSWKAYMRRQTVTVNWGDELPLAQGIEFG